MNLIKKFTPGFIKTLSLGYIHVYDHFSQTRILVYISGERLQDNWSSSKIFSRIRRPIIVKLDKKHGGEEHFKVFMTLTYFMARST